VYLLYNICNGQQFFKTFIFIKGNDRSVKSDLTHGATLLAISRIMVSATSSQLELYYI